MSKIVTLDGVKLHENGANPDVIAYLERLTAEAKRGEIVDLAVAVTARNGDVRTGWEGTNGVRLGAAVSVLFHRYMQSLVDNQFDTPEFDEENPD